MRGFGGMPAGMSCGLMPGPEKTGPRSSWNSFRLSARTLKLIRDPGKEKFACDYQL